MNVSLKNLKITSFRIITNSVEKKQLKPINELIKKFSNTYKFCNGNTNRFALLLEKCLSIWIHI